MNAWGARAPTSGWGAAGRTWRGPLARYKSFLSEGGTRVPAIVSWPGHIDGRRSDHVVSVMDVMPTVLELVGLGEEPGAEAFHGVSLAAGLLDASREGPRAAPLALEIYGNKAVWDGRWKLHWNWNASRWYLFDLLDDPGETADLSLEHPERTARMAEYWDAFAEANSVYRFDREMGYGRYADQRPDAQ